MKFSYLVVAFFVICAWFSCTEENAVGNTTADFKIMVDTIITFDPETYEENIQTITYKISADGKDTLERTIANLGSNQVEETIQIVKDEKTGVIDTIITVTIPE